MKDRSLLNRLMPVLWGRAVDDEELFVELKNPESEASQLLYSVLALSRAATGPESVDLETMIEDVDDTCIEEDKAPAQSHMLSRQEQRVLVDNVMTIVSSSLEEQKEKTSPHVREARKLTEGVLKSTALLPNARFIFEDIIAAFSPDNVEDPNLQELFQRLNAVYRTWDCEQEQKQLDLAYSKVLLQPGKQSKTLAKNIPEFTNLRRRRVRYLVGISVAASVIIAFGRIFYPFEYFLNDTIVVLETSLTRGNESFQVKKTGEIYHVGETFWVKISCSRPGVATVAMVSPAKTEVYSKFKGGSINVKANEPYRFGVLESVPGESLLVVLIADDDVSMLVREVLSTIDDASKGYEDVVRNRLEERFRQSEHNNVSCQVVRMSQTLASVE